MKVQNSRPTAPSILAGAAEAGADAETLVMIQAAKDAQESRKSQSQARQAALQDRAKYLMAAADQLHKQADLARQNAVVGLCGSVLNLVGTAAGAALGGAMAPAGQAMSGAGFGAQVGAMPSQLMQNAYNVANAGKMEEIQEVEKRLEARAEAAQEDVELAKDGKGEAQRLLSSLMQQIQRYEELKSRGAEIAQRQ
jgi:hypothetical protein